MKLGRLRSPLGRRGASASVSVTGIATLTATGGKNGTATGTGTAARTVTGQGPQQGPGQGPQQGQGPRQGQGPVPQPSQEGPPPEDGFDVLPEGGVPPPMPGLPAVPGLPPAPGMAGLPPLPGAPAVAAAPSQQATRHARRVYVGGLPPTANEQSIATFFSHALAAVGGTTMGAGECVVNVYINAEKKFAFVEFRTVEETSNAMALDGILFEGVTVRVRRPNDYNPTAAAQLGPSVPNPNLNLAAIGLQGVTSTAADGPDRIFIGGLPYYWAEEQCKELLQSFGPIKAFDLVRDRDTGNSKGYGFVVYQDPAVTDPACAGLNGMKIGDKTLTVRRATAAGQAKPENVEVLMQAQSQIAQLQAGLATGSLPLAGMMGGMMGAPAMGMGMVPDPLATPVLTLTNCFDLEELNDDEMYTEIKEDMEEECGKYGKVETLLIPRPLDENKSGMGKVIIKYGSADEAARAKAAMHGRRFGGKTVQAVYISVENFQAGILD
eukprot:CAMPEP_0117657448 /NCGR_PEP_ID=MMETSP0804-20121206/5336_1 /TAXON_ID=1074897 /ORGANISM="Tetraselmis astigmatica, Strain CCMP880" /LENGTH=493 /DNA_ID=CAMNT_0005463903 /DNA_START=90 /DNA_END=1573 /DNA_ORIENTATION=-